MHLVLSQTSAVLSHQAYEDKTRDSVIKRHVQWHAKMGDEIIGGHFEYLL